MSAVGSPPAAGTPRGAPDTASYCGLELAERTYEHWLIAATDNARAVWRDGNVAIDAIRVASTVRLVEQFRRFFFRHRLLPQFRQNVEKISGR